ncbi:MAG: hypothetical protein LBT22_00545 [Peptococcaceae bacterium]|jgi:hypothetical protein|nr:hypothetical protein [Peptococcaceae bacterium]
MMKKLAGTLSAAGIHEGEMILRPVNDSGKISTKWNEKSPISGKKTDAGDLSGVNKTSTSESSSVAQAPKL